MNESGRESLSDPSRKSLITGASVLDGFFLSLPYGNSLAVAF